MLHRLSDAWKRMSSIMRRARRVWTVRGWLVRSTGTLAQFREARQGVAGWLVRTWNWEE